MATSIQVTEETLERLRAAKAQSGAATYDELIRQLLVTHAKRALPLKGMTPGLGPFVRDPNDRD